MPLVTIYTEEPKLITKLEIFYELKEYIAEQLSCKNRALDLDEVSIRVIKSYGNGTGYIKPIEIVILAYSYPERVKKQDIICLNIKNFLKSKNINESFIWLQLSELGHSANN